MVSPPPSCPWVGEHHLPADVRGRHLVVLALSQHRPREAVLVAGVEVVLTGVVKDRSGALHLQLPADLPGWVRHTHVRCGGDQRGRHRAEVTSFILSCKDEKDRKIREKITHQNPPFKAYFKLFAASSWFIVPRNTQEQNWRTDIQLRASVTRLSSCHTPVIPSVPEKGIQDVLILISVMARLSLSETRENKTPTNRRILSAPIVTDRTEVTGELL